MPIFPGVPANHIERFFINMCASDMNLPHTSTRLSPITFNEFMIRNQILTTVPFDIYDEANKIWVKTLEQNPGLFKLSGLRATHEMDLCEQKHKGWNEVIDYLNRLVDVEKFDDSPYFQMHYIAHICYLFIKMTDQYEIDKCMTYRTIFNDLISPILYESCIPTTYAFLPVKKSTDVKFQHDMTTMLIKVKDYIVSHSANRMNTVLLDGSRVKQFAADVKEILTAIHNVKYMEDNAWKTHLRAYLNRVLVYKYDFEMFELYPVFKRDGMKSIKIVDDLLKIKKHFDAGCIMDADDAIDQLLGVYGDLLKAVKEVEPGLEKIEKDRSFVALPETKKKTEAKKK